MTTNTAVPEIKRTLTPELVRVQIAVDPLEFFAECWMPEIRGKCIEALKRKPASFWDDPETRQRVEGYISQLYAQDDSEFAGALYELYLFRSSNYFVAGIINFGISVVNTRQDREWLSKVVAGRFAKFEHADEATDTYRRSTRLRNFLYQFVRDMAPMTSSAYPGYGDNEWAVIERVLMILLRVNDRFFIVHLKELAAHIEARRRYPDGSHSEYTRVLHLAALRYVVDELRK